MSKIENA